MVRAKVSQIYIGQGWPKSGLVVNQSTQTADPNYPFNWVELTRGSNNFFKPEDCMFDYLAHQTNERSTKLWCHFFSQTPSIYYYNPQKNLTKYNVKNVQKCRKSDRGEILFHSTVSVRLMYALFCLCFILFVKELKRSTKI